MTIDDEGMNKSDNLLSLNLSLRKFNWPLNNMTAPGHEELEITGTIYVNQLSLSQNYGSSRFIL